jgi:hypothetical protein
MDMHVQIARDVRQIEMLKDETAKHWTSAKQNITDGRMDHAVTLLNAYFYSKPELAKTEARLASLLHSCHSDK